LLIKFYFNVQPSGSTLDRFIHSKSCQTFLVVSSCLSRYISLNPEQYKSQSPFPNQHDVPKYSLFWSKQAEVFRLRNLRYDQLYSMDYCWSDPSPPQLAKVWYISCHQPWKWFISEYIVSCLIRPCWDRRSWNQYHTIHSMCLDKPTDFTVSLPRSSLDNDPIKTISTLWIKQRRSSPNTSTCVSNK
jgi:hypothetical protein